MLYKIDIIDGKRIWMFMDRYLRMMLQWRANLGDRPSINVEELWERNS